MAELNRGDSGLYPRLIRTADDMGLKTITDKRYDRVCSDALA